MEKALDFFPRVVSFSFLSGSPRVQTGNEKFSSIFLGRGARHDKKYDDNYKKGKNPFCCPAAIMEKARKVGRGILFNLFQPPPSRGGGGIPTHNKRRGKGKKYLLSSQQQT